MREKKQFLTSVSSHLLPSNIVKRPSRREKEKKILVDLVEYYIKTGRPVGSHALKSESILNVSSATIRNYFSSLEAEHYLKQQHTSGGRVPQQKAYKLYASHCVDLLQGESPEITASFEQSEELNFFEESLSENLEPAELIASIQVLMSKLSKRLSLAVVGSAPRFDQDAITDIRYIYIDSKRLLSIIITEFGLIHTTILAIDQVRQGAIKKAERFARMKLFHEIIDEGAINELELEIAKRLYQETMSSYFVMYSSVSEEDIFKTGFSNVFSNPDFQDPAVLKPALLLFENSSILRDFLRSSVASDELHYWIGNDLAINGESISDEISFISVPYHIGNRSVGALGVLSPIRVNYKEIFRVMSNVARLLSQYLTTGLTKHRITFRMPQIDAIRFDSKEAHSLGFSQSDS